MKKRTIYAALTLAVGIFFLTGCGNSSKNFTDQVKEGNYSKAIEIYDKSILGNAERENDCIQFLNSYLEECWSGYAQGTLSEDEFNSAFSTLEKINERFDLLPDISDGSMESMFNEVKYSKDSFKQGLESMESGNYLAAMDNFSWTSALDTENFDLSMEKYEECEDSYLDTVVVSAQELMKNGAYEEAIATIEEAQNVVGYSEELVAVLQQIHIEHFITAMTAARDAGDYAQVISLYAQAQEGGLQPTAEMTSLYAESSTALLSDLQEAAAAAFGENKDYSAAILLLQGSLSRITDDGIVNKITEMIDGYNEYIPVPLTDLEYTQRTYSTDGSTRIIIGYDSYLGDKIYTDVNGTAYDTDNVICFYDYGSQLHRTADADGYVMYNLNLLYSTFSGVIYRPYQTLKREDIWSGETAVQIYGDDVLLYEAPDISSDTYDPVPFSISVAGVRNLKIVMSGTWGKGYPLVCLAEGMLQK